MTIDDVLYCMFEKYLNEINALREENVDINNIDFHRKNELWIKVPWNATESLIRTLLDKRTFVFYSNTASYNSFYQLLGSDAHDQFTFTSFYEFHHAIISSQEDIRSQQQIKSEMASASVVVVLDVERCPNVVLNAIRQFTNDCLILIG